MALSHSFRVNAKNYFINYPRCSLSIKEALSQLQHLEAPTNKKFIRVCQEQHEDGSPHLHVLIQFEGKFSCRNPRFFDLVSPSRSAHFHLNIQGAKSSSDVKAYIEKDGVHVDWGEFQIDSRSSRGGQQSINEVYANALNSGNKSDAFKIIREFSPKDYVLQFHNINSNLDRIFPQPPKLYISTFTSFTITDDMQQWVGENLILEEGATAPPLRPRSIIIEGASRTGKTQWARSLGSHNYLSGHLESYAVLVLHLTVDSLLSCTFVIN